LKAGLQTAPAERSAGYRLRFAAAARLTESGGADRLLQSSPWLFST
jgi:hypothetical protein